VSWRGKEKLKSKRDLLDLRTSKTAGLNLNMILSTEQKIMRIKILT
jgi:hypothetical protein